MLDYCANDFKNVSTMQIVDIKEMAEFVLQSAVCPGFSEMCNYAFQKKMI